LEFDFGARYLFTKNTAVRGDFLYTLTGTNTNAGLGFMLSLVNIFDF